MWGTPGILCPGRRKWEWLCRSGKAPPCSTCHCGPYPSWGTGLWKQRRESYYLTTFLGGVVGGSDLHIADRRFLTPVLFLTIIYRTHRWSLTVDPESRGGREPVGLLTFFRQLLISQLEVQWETEGIFFLGLLLIMNLSCNMEPCEWEQEKRRKCIHTT